MNQIHLYFKLITLILRERGYVEIRITIKNVRMSTFILGWGWWNGARMGFSINIFLSKIVLYLLYN